MILKTLKTGFMVTVANAIVALSTGSIYAQAKKPAAPAAPVAPAAKPAAAEVAKPEAAKAEATKADPKKTEPAKAEAAANPATATPAKEAPKSDHLLTQGDPALMNDKDMLPNGHFSHRVAHPKEEKLTLIGRIQMRAMSGQGESMYSTPGTDFGLVDFNFRRLRLGAMYQGDHHWGMIINLRLENALARQTLTTSTNGAGNVTAVTLNDARGLIQEANIWYNLDFMRTRFILGMQNVPFTREYIMSSANLINVERSMGTNPQNQFDNGFAIMMNPLKAIDKSLDRYLTLWGMIGTGHGGAGDFGFGRRVDSQSVPTTAGTNYAGGVGGTPTSSNYTPADPAFYGRVQINALGGLKRGSREVGWQDGEEIFQKDLKLSLGAAFMGSNGWKINTPMPVEYAPRQTNNVGTATASPGDNSVGWTLLQAAASQGTGTGNCQSAGACSLFAQTYDIVATWRGTYLSGAYMYYGGGAGQNITSYNVTAGYNLPLGISTYIMPIIRYDYLTGNFGTQTWHANMGSGLSSDPANQMGLWYVGLNLFGDKHLFKVQVFYQINKNNLKGYDTAANGSGALGGYAMNVLTFQVQGTFWTGADIANKPEHSDL